MMLSAVTLAILAASCASAKVVDVQGISSVTSLKDADLFAVGAGAFEASSITRRQSEFPSFDSGDSDGEVDGGAVMAEGETSFMGPDGNEFGTGWAAASGDEFTVGDGIEKADSASAPSCLVYINKFRKSLGVPALKYVASRSTCVANQAQEDTDAGWHVSFGECGEWGQTECKGPTKDVAGCVQTYVDEGKSGKHYQILANPKYKAVSCGTHTTGGQTFYVQDFFLSADGENTVKPPTTTARTTTARTTTARPTTTARTTARPTQTSTPTSTGGGGGSCTIGTTALNNKAGMSSCDCLNIINTFRAQQGRSALTYNAAKEPCVNQEAQNDNSQGYHATFGACQERGQCECNGYSSLQQCMQAYISEGPGGGHYEILKDARYTSVACGIFDKGGGRYFFTHSFY